jgi:subfamily B ATP-binding cassette protein MsbA
MSHKNLEGQPSDRQIIARLWKHYIWLQKGKLFAAFFFMVLLAIATAAYTEVVRRVVDEAQKLNTSGESWANAMAYAKLIIPFLIGVPIISGVSNYAQRILTNSIALNAIGDMQKAMFKSAHAADLAAFSEEPTGNLISKFTNDVSIVSGAIIRVLGNLFRDVLVVVFLISAMLYHNWQLSAVMAIFLIALLPILNITKKMRGNARDVQEHIGVITSQLKESFGGARLIKTYNLEKSEKRRLGKSFDERIRLFLKLVTQQARVDPILEVIGGLAIAGIVIFGAYQVNAGSATGGSIAAVLVALLMLSPKLRALGTLNNVLQEGLSAASRIFDVIDKLPEIREIENAQHLGKVDGKIDFKNVGFSYSNGKVALSELTLSIKPTETVAFVGASGGGKSTLINLIPRLYDVTSGVITVDDIDIRDVTLHSLRQNIALVSQNVTLFDDTVAANIALGNQDAKPEDIINAAKNADAHDFIMALPQGYETNLGEDGLSLSGGQRQRLSIARALLRDTPILLLDEATSALDAASETKVQKALQRLSTGRTTLIIAHKLSTIQTADKIYVLDQGHIIESGTHKTLQQKPNGAYAKLLTLQATH